MARSSAAITSLQPTRIDLSFSAVLVSAVELSPYVLFIDIYSSINGRDVVIVNSAKNFIAQLASGTNGAKRLQGLLASYIHVANQHSLVSDVIGIINSK